VVLTACGGSENFDAAGDGAGPVVDETDDEAGADSGDASSGGQAVTGLVASLNDFGLGLFEVDAVTGESRQLTMEGVEFVDRTHPPIIVGDRAWMLTLTTIDGQDFSQVVGVGRVDLVTGEGDEIVVLGPNRENDESAETISYRLVGADRDSAWVSIAPFGSSAIDVVHRRIDATTGETITELAGLEYSFESDAASCTAELRNPMILPDGSFVGLAGGWPATVDIETGEITATVPWCESGAESFEPFRLRSLVPPEAINDYAVPEDARPVPPEALDDFFGFGSEPAPSGGAYVVSDDGHFWWVFSDLIAYQRGDTAVNTIVGGVVRFDPVAGEVVDVWPLGELAGHWLSAQENGYSGLSGPELAHVGGDLWVVDGREDAPVLRLDPETGTIDVLPVPKGDDIDLTQVSLVGADDDGIWLEVSRRIITTDDEAGRTTTGTLFLDRIDAGVGAFTLSVPERDILGL
ncbi:MAG: hypothetical protein OEU32_06070, partial [Acidimicrobiia bacterium]|nr:hypothetical protein [Acidimicrobiia bacterium]